MLTDLSNLLNQALEANQISLTDSEKQKIIHFLELIHTWNRVFNLTSILNPRDMVYLHILDSLIIKQFLHGIRFLDIGTGAGLPGIPLAIINPQQQWVLLDKNSKKTRFLTQVVAEIGLTNVEIVHSRCENFHPEQCFDTILSRAFGTIRMFVESTNHLLCPDGNFIAMKGKYPQEELNDVPPHFKVTNVAHLEMEGINVSRHIVLLSKHVGK